MNDTPGASNGSGGGDRQGGVAGGAGAGGGAGGAGGRRRFPPCNTCGRLHLPTQACWQICGRCNTRHHFRARCPVDMRREQEERERLQRQLEERERELNLIEASTMGFANPFAPMMQQPGMMGFGFSQNPFMPAMLLGSGMMPQQAMPFVGGRSGSMSFDIPTDAARTIGKVLSADTRSVYRPLDRNPRSGSRFGKKQQKGGKEKAGTITSQEEEHPAGVLNPATSGITKPTKSQKSNAKRREKKERDRAKWQEEGYKKRQAEEEKKKEQGQEEGEAMDVDNAQAGEQGAADVVTANESQTHNDAQPSVDTAEGAVAEVTRSGAVESTPQASDDSQPSVVDPALPGNLSLAIARRCMRVLFR